MYASCLDFQGLYTFPNPLAKVPVGACLVCDNLNGNKDGIAECRRGVAQFANQLTTGSSVSGNWIDQFFSFQERLLAIVKNTGAVFYQTISGLDVTTFLEAPYTLIPPVSTGLGPNVIGSQRIRGEEANKNFYFTNLTGVIRITSFDDVSEANSFFAGVPPALDGSAILSSVGSGFLGSMEQCAYQVVFGHTDANGNLVLGSPSQRILIVNSTGGSDNVSIHFTIPQNLDPTYFFQLYRTPQTTFSVTPSLNVPPGAELQLAAQYNLTALQISQGSLTYQDVTPDALLGATLYTSPSQEGALQTNNPPPSCQDMCNFSEMMFYANCATLQSFQVNLISVGAPNGLQIGDLFEIDNRGFRASSAQDNSTLQFMVVSTGTVSENIDATARNLVQCINANVAITNVYAYYISGYNSLPGQILLQAVQYAQLPFGVGSSNTTAFSPALSTTEINSTFQSLVNGIFVSKVGQPEAVPPINLIFVGGGDKLIYRVLPLRDRVIVLKQDGVWVITGTTPDALNITLLDSTVICTSPDTAVLLNNSVYCLTQQGVVSITESGVTILSRAIEGDILRYAKISTPVSSYATNYGISYESERLYILCLSMLPTDTYPTQAYCYNWITNVWTRWPLDIGAGIVPPVTDILYISRPTFNNGFVYQERKNLDYTDFIDDAYPVTLTSVDSSGLVVSMSTTVLETWIGYGLAQVVDEVLYTAIIDSVDMNANTVTVDILNSSQPNIIIPWAAGDAQVQVPIPMNLTFAPITGGFPHYMKVWGRVNFWFNYGNFSTIQAGYFTDVDLAGTTQPLQSIITGLYGIGAYGPLPYGGASNYLQAIQTLPTQETSLGRFIEPTLQLSFPGARLSCCGTTISYDLQSDVSG